VEIGGGGFGIHSAVNETDEVGEMVIAKQSVIMPFGPPARAKACTVDRRWRVLPLPSRKNPTFRVRPRTPIICAKNHLNPSSAAMVSA